MADRDKNRGSGAPWDSWPLVIGHRGAPCRAYENSLAAIDTAIALGADMVEIDVRRTCDGALVLHHDATVGGRRVRSLPHTALRTPENDVPPTLEEAARLTKGRALLDVEIKQSGYEGEALEQLTRHLSPAEFVVTSFQDRVIERLKVLRPDVWAGLLVGPGQGDPSHVLARAEACGADLIAPHFRRSAPAILEHARRQIPMFIWTVNNPATIDTYLQAGVAGIITDVPDVAVERRAARHRQGQDDKAA